MKGGAGGHNGTVIDIKAKGMELPRLRQAEEGVSVDSREDRGEGGTLRGAIRHQDGFAHKVVKVEGD